MRHWMLVVAAIVTIVLGTASAQAPKAPVIRAVAEARLREYAGVYQWAPNAYLYLQLWSEFSGFNNPSELVAFDESGDVRTLYPTDRDRFFAGPGIAVPTSVESRIEFQRDEAGQITSLRWRREGGVSRAAQRVEIETREDVRFTSRDLKLAGTLISPATAAKHPAIILVHGSGIENRESMLPFARFLIRHGIAVLGYDKRGVGGSMGDWTTASFDDLADDVVAAFAYLKTRADIDHTQIGLLGVSQAGWIMPLVAVRERDTAFLISISGAGVPAAETTIDRAQNEMTTAGMRREDVEDIVGLLKLQYEFARSGRGWDEYAAARAKIAARMGTPPDWIPGAADHPYWGFIRRLFFYDPLPILRQLQVPTLAIWGELDNNIQAEKNHTAWAAALKAGGNPDYTLRILPGANHAQFEAKVGSSAEMASLKGFVPAYFATIHDWLAERIHAIDASP
jgi:pimeloyl-ACP methyl ester carboxylesterase